MTQSGCLGKSQLHILSFFVFTHVLCVIFYNEKNLNLIRLRKFLDIKHVLLSLLDFQVFFKPHLFMNLCEGEQEVVTPLVAEAPAKCGEQEA